MIAAQPYLGNIIEYYITGGASDWEKFEKWAETLERAISLGLIWQ